MFSKIIRTISTYTKNFDISQLKFNIPQRVKITESSVINDIASSSKHVDITESSVINDIASSSKLSVVMTSSSTGIIRTSTHKYYFCLKHCQSGKTRIMIYDIQNLDPTQKIIPIVISINDINLTLQTAGRVEEDIEDHLIYKLCTGGNRIGDVEMAIDNYITGTGKRPIILALANRDQLPKIKKMMEDKDALFALYIDEVDQVYPLIRKILFENDPTQLEHKIYKQFMISATVGTLLEQGQNDYPEIRTARTIYRTDYPSNFFDHSKYRDLLSEDTRHFIIPQKHLKNNQYILSILLDPNNHFQTPVQQQNGEFTYRKIIVNADYHLKEHDKLAKTLSDNNFYTIVYNGKGVSYRENSLKVCGKEGQENVSECIYTLYRNHRLNDKPLVLIGNKKIDRGITFHRIPKIGDKDQRALLFTDEIIGNVPNASTASQKGSRANAYISDRPEYVPLTFWLTKETYQSMTQQIKIIDKVLSRSDDREFGDIYNESKIQVEEESEREERSTSKTRPPICIELTEQKWNHYFPGKAKADRQTKTDAVLKVLSEREDYVDVSNELRTMTLQRAADDIKAESTRKRFIDSTYQCYLQQKPCLLCIPKDDPCYQTDFWQYVKDHENHRLFILRHFGSKTE